MEKNSHKVLHVIKKCYFCIRFRKGSTVLYHVKHRRTAGSGSKEKRFFFLANACTERKDGYLCHPEPKGSAARRRLKKVQKTLKKSWSERKDAYLCSPDSKEWWGLHSKTDTDEGAPSGATTIHRAAPGGGMNGPNVL